MLITQISDQGTLAEIIKNAAKLIDKFNNLAREALSSGDKILSENYLQHADHFTRILNLQEMNKNQTQNNNVIEQNFKKDIEDVQNENTKISKLETLETTD